MRMSRFRAAALALLGAAIAYAYGCSSDRPPVADEGSSPSGGLGKPGDDVRTGPCDQEGQTVSCHIETGRVGNIVNCFSGTQICQAGMWGPCGPAAGGATTTSINISQ